MGFLEVPIFHVWGNFKEEGYEVAPLISCNLVSHNSLANIDLNHS